MKTQSIAIVAGGSVRVGQLSSVRKASYIIGVDHGAYWLAKHRVHMDLAIGDFDSVSKSERKHVERGAERMVVHPAKKDATDLELAIEESCALHPTSVDIYGVLGNRFDHSCGAIQMLLRLESHNISGQIVDNFNIIYIVRRKMTIRKDSAFPYVSIIPLVFDTVVTLKGFVYDIANVHLHTDSSLGLSNEIRYTHATIVVHAGLVLVVRSHD